MVTESDQRHMTYLQLVFKLTWQLVNIVMSRIISHSQLEIIQYIWRARSLAEAAGDNGAKMKRN